MNEQEFPHKQPFSDQNSTSNSGQQGPVDYMAMQGMQETLPNSTGILILGILSIVTCFCYGIIGIVLAIIAMIMASQAKKLLAANPERYSISSVKNMKAGYLCAIIGLVLSILYIVFVVVYFIAIGSFILNPMFWEQFAQ